MLDLKHLLAAVALFVSACFVYSIQAPQKEVPPQVEVVSAAVEPSVESVRDGGSVNVPDAAGVHVETSEPVLENTVKTPSQHKGADVKAEKSTGEEGSSGKTQECLPKPKASAVNSSHVPVKVGLVIDDFGHSYKIAKQILDMNLTATWAVIPGTSEAEKVAELARSRGQPFLVHLPMQAVSDKDGSSEYLIGVDTPSEKIHSYVEKFKEKFPDAIGVNNHRGSKATSDRATMEEFMSAMAATDWGFLDSRTIGKTVAKKVAQEYHIPAAENRIFLDGTTDLSTQKKRFQEALKMGRRNGSVIAICHARVTTLPFLRYISKTDFGHVEFVTVDKLWK